MKNDIGDQKKAIEEKIAKRKAARELSNSLLEIKPTRVVRY